MAMKPTPSIPALSLEDELRLDETVVCTNELRWFVQEGSDQPRLQQGYRVISGPREGLIYWVDVPIIVGSRRDRS
jgi:hypothetical protein